MNKKYRLLMTVAVAAMLIGGVGLTAPALAAECGGVETSIIDCNNTGAGSIREMLMLVINILSVGIGVVALIGILVAGIQYMTARDNAQQSAKAKRRLYELVIGLAVYVLLWTGLQWLVPGGAFSGDTEVTAVSLGAVSVQVVEGNTMTLIPTTTPIDADNTSFTWVSSDTNVATVDSKGKVTAKTVGETTITVTTSNGTEGSTTVKVVEPAASGAESGGSGGSGGGGGTSGPSTAGRHRIGNALAGMHAANDGNINAVKEAVDSKYWGMECDIQYYHGALMCYHDSRYRSSSSATLAETMSVCKAGGTKVILDLKVSGSEGLTALGNYIRDNNLQNWVVVQTGNLTSMRKLNEVVGSKLEYWGLVMDTSGSLNSFTNKASEYQGLGMTTVNVPLVAGDYRQGSNANIRRLQNAGYDVAAFTWVSFSQSAISNYDSLGVKYLMTNHLQ